MLGPGCADPFGPKAVRASMGSIFARPPRAGRPRGARAAAWSASSPTAARRPTTNRSAGSAWSGEREGLPAEVADACDRLWTIPLRGGAESLNVAAAAADRHRTDIVGPPDGRADRQPARGGLGGDRRGGATASELEELRVHYLGRKSELTSILRGIADLAAGRARPGRLRRQRGAQGARGASSRRATRELEATELERSLAAGAIDVTMPGAPPPPTAAQNLLVRTQREIEDVFVGLGYR